METVDGYILLYVYTLDRLYIYEDGYCMMLEMWKLKKDGHCR
jgi:hypothetical protein